MPLAPTGHWLMYDWLRAHKEKTSSQMYLVWVQSRPEHALMLTMHNQRSNRLFPYLVLICCWFLALHMSV